MPNEYGLSVDSKGLVQQLKNNLIDRYPRDAILKELLQNADDAGATRLEVGWSPGLGESAPHSLLRGPGMFVVNDGPFKPGDAEAIKSFGLNYKAADRSTIGKFGLGLKSVFHLCEAFFYAAHDGTECAPTRSLINPWCGTGFHDDWNHLVDDALAGIERHLAPLLAKPQGGPDNRDWFVLWLPLRRAEHCELGAGDSEVRTISLHSDHPGDDGEGALNKFADQAAAVADTLPLLRSVRRVRYWECWDARGPGRLRSEVALGGDAPRCLFRETNAAHGDGFGSVQFGPPDAAVPLNYVIREQWVGGLKRLWDDPGWPTSMSFASHPVKDKAQPHAAVTLSCRPAAGDGRVSVARAVFLPLHGDLSHGERGLAADYSVRLHGCFFVDAGRGRPVVLPESLTGQEPSGEDRVRAVWNERLLREGVCPLVLPALDEFVGIVRPNDSDTRALTRVLGGLTFDGIGELRESLMQGGQWLYCWSAREPGWRLLDAEGADFLEIPDLAAGQNALAAEVLPGLARIADRIRVTPQGCPRVAREYRLQVWAGELVVEALGASEAEPMLENWQPGHWEYLARFLQFAPNPPGDAECDRLSQLLRRAFTVIPVDRLRKSLADVRRVVRHLPPGQRLALWGLDTLTAPERSDVFEYPLEALILPGEFDPPDTASAARLPAGDTAALLALLEPVCRRDPQIRLPLAVFEAVTDRAALKREPSFVGLELWLTAIHAGVGHRAELLSYTDLARLLADRVVFRDSRDMADFRHLVAALEGVAVYDLPASTADGLFAAHEVPACEPRAVARLLNRHPPLSGDAGRRAGLVRALLAAVPHPIDAAAWRSAGRYLLHARHDRADSVARLLAGDERAEGVWWHIARTYLRQSGGDWQILDPRLAGRIGSDDRKTLDVVGVDATGVAELLGIDGAVELEIELGDPERDEVLLAWRDRRDLLRAMPIHDGVRGGRHRIGDGCYWQNRYALAGPLADRVILLRPSADTIARSIQLELEEELRPVHIIGLALDAGPADHWAELTTAIGEAGNLPAELRDRLRAAQWIPAVGRGPVAPKDVVLDDSAAINQEIARVLAACPTSGLVGESGLDPAVRDHEKFAALRRLCSPSRGDLLGRLAGAVSHAGEEFGIGLRLDDDRQIESWLAAFANAPGEVSRVSALIAAVWRVDTGACRERLLPSLMPAPRESGLTPGRARIVLGFLAGQHERGVAKRESRAVHDRYLEAAADLPEWAEEVLPHLRLLNANGVWRPVGELCVATNLDPAATLDAGQTAVLGAQARREESRSAPTAATSKIAASKSLLAAWRIDAPERLREFFKLWRVRDDYAAWAGAFLALLGDLPEIAALAREFLPQGHTAEAIRAAANLQPRERTIGSRTVADSPADLMRLQRVTVIVTDVEDRLKVANLVGRDIVVAANEDFGDLFIGGGVSHAGTYQGDGGYLEAHLLNLRFISRGRLEREGPEVVRGWITATTDRLLREVYGQRGATIADALPGLTDRDLEIRVAQLVALDARSTLLQLGHLDHAGLQNVLGDYNNAVGKKAEERVLDESKVTRSADWTTSEELERVAQNRLRELIETDADARNQLLAGLRRKLADYRYRPQAVLFELFQNADDAAVELGGDAEPRFAVRETADGLTVMHRGRPVNRPGVHINPEVAARDLRKMLALGHSDKGAGGPAVTGRFGLGFKSVFLIAYRPRLLSGKLAVEVLGGLYPTRLAQSDADGLRAALKDAEIDPERGTAVDLLLVPDCDREQVVGRYRQFAAYLCAFARRTRRCDWIGGAHREEARWDAGDPLDAAKLAAAGRLTPFDAGRDVTPGRALVLHTAAGDGALLFGMGVDGFVPLHKAVPSIWVTAPTEESHDLGYAVNGPFHLDVGRFQVTWNDSENVQHFSRLGADFGAAIVAVFDACEDSEWGDVQSRLGLVCPDRYALWESFWATTSRVSTAPAALQVMMWGPDGCAARLYHQRPALPTGIKVGGHRLLTKVGDVSAFLAGELDENPAVIAGVADWPSFRRLTPGSVVSERVGSRLRQLGPDWVPEVPRIDLAELVLRELDDSPRFDPDRAALLGQVVTRARPEIRGLLKERAEFRNRAGGWVKAAELLLPTAPDDDFRDEALRAAFAPFSRVLADEYVESAIDFYLVARDHLVARIEHMVEWAVEADTADRQAAVRRYMAEGAQAFGFNRALQARVRGTWLERITDAEISTTATDTYQACLIRLTLGRLNVTSVSSPESVPAGRPAARPDGWGRRLATWWGDESEQWLWWHDTNSVPGGRVIREIQADPDALTVAGRRAWLQLFVAGIQMTIGRTTTGQHGGFFNLCESRGWFDTLTDRRDGTASWLREVGEYLDEPAQHVQYYHMLREAFLGTAFVARHLDEFVCALRSIDQMAGSSRIEEVFAVRISQQFSGSGLDAPPLGPALGIGACHVVRELCHARIVKDEWVAPYCYPPFSRVREVLHRLGWEDPGDEATRWERSRSIHNFLAQDLADPTFDGAYDIPLLALAENSELRQRILGG